MAFVAKYIHTGDIVNYTPTVDVAAGDVVFIGKVAGVAKLDIKANVLGALSLTGVYAIAKGTDKIAAGTALYWDAANKIASVTVNDTPLGIAIDEAASDATAVNVLLNCGV